MSPLVKALLGWALFLAVETAVQTVFKLSGSTIELSGGVSGVLAHVLTSPVILGGFVLYFGGFVIWLTILKDADLGRAFPMTAVIYLCTLAVAIFYFGEHMNLVRWIGVATIVAGVVLLAADENKAERLARAEAPAP